MSIARALVLEVLASTDPGTLALGEMATGALRSQGLNMNARQQAELNTEHNIFAINGCTSSNLSTDGEHILVRTMNRTLSMNICS